MLRKTPFLLLVFGIFAIPSALIGQEKDRGSSDSSSLDVLFGSQNQSSKSSGLDLLAGNSKKVAKPSNLDVLFGTQKRSSNRPGLNQVFGTQKKDSNQRLDALFGNQVKSSNQTRSNVAPGNQKKDRNLDTLDVLFANQTRDVDYSFFKFFAGNERRDLLPQAENTIVVNKQPIAKVHHFNFENRDQDQVDQLNDDLKVMAKVLSNEIVNSWRGEGEDRHEPSHSSKLILKSDVHYLQGYGVCFNLLVNFQVSGFGKSNADNKKGEANADPKSPWIIAKAQLEERKRPRVTAYRNLYISRALFSGQHERQVKKVVDHLTLSLKEAKNIRHLKDSDFLTISIQGSIDLNGKLTQVGLRVRQKDVLALAKKQIDQNEFIKRVQRVD